MVLQGVLAGILLKLGYSGAPISLAARVRRPGESVSQDITFRLLCLNERRLARMPVVLDGLTGVGKTFPLKVYAGKPRGFECANWRVGFGSWYTLLVGKRSQTKTTEYEGVPARHTLAFPLTRPQPATRDTPRMCIFCFPFETPPNKAATSRDTSSCQSMVTLCASQKGRSPLEVQRGTKQKQALAGGSQS